MSAQDWYSVKTVYRHHLVEDGAPKPLFEERVVLFRADSFDEAILHAEAEAARYCADSCVHLEYINYLMAYHRFSEEIGHATEVFSLMRDSMLSNNEYLDRFYSDGHEHSQTAP